MTDRYNKFAEFNVRDMKGYNAKVAELPPDENGKKPEKLPQIVIIVDELADLMMVAPEKWRMRSAVWHSLPVRPASI